VCIQFTDDNFAFCVDTFVPSNDKSLVGSVLETINVANNGNYEACANYMVETSFAYFATLDSTGTCHVYDSQIFSLLDIDYSDPKYYSPCSFSFFYNIGQIGVAPGCTQAAPEVCVNAAFPSGVSLSSSSTSSLSSSSTSSTTSTTSSTTSGTSSTASTISSTTSSTSSVYQPAGVYSPWKA
jgi:hypothetical protein